MPRSVKGPGVADHAHEFCSTLEEVSDHPPGVGGMTARAALLNAAFWGRGVRLRVGFLEGAPELHQRVADLARAWPQETRANFDFEFWVDNGRDPGDADIRISFRPDLGSFSKLGRYARTVEVPGRTMNLGWMTLDLGEDKARAVVLHEFGHALGLVHEHMNPAQQIQWDVERVRADLRQSQGWDDAKIDANMFVRYAPDQIFGTDVDKDSIMMYPIPPGWTRDGFTVGFNTNLTEVDKSLIRAAYGVRPNFGG